MEQQHLKLQILSLESKEKLFWHSPIITESTKVKRVFVTVKAGQNEQSIVQGKLHGDFKISGFCDFLYR